MGAEHCFVAPETPGYTIEVWAKRGDFWNRLTVDGPRTEARRAEIVAQLKEWGCTQIRFKCPWD